MEVVFDSGFVAKDFTTFEKLNSGFCSYNFLASGYVKLFVTFILITSFSFFQAEHSFDLDRCSPPQFTHFVGFWQWLVW